VEIKMELVESKKDVWEILQNEDRIYQVIFEEEVTEDEAVELWKAGRGVEDVLDEEVVEVYSVVTFD
jgi:hypothetical protein